MLRQLSVKNFAIIDDIEINFKEGLTVITGETGAGKSIIADAIDFLLGDRVSTDIIKSGTDKAIVEGVFAIVGSSNDSILQKYLAENGFMDDNSSELFLSRELSQQGSKVRINGSLGNVSQLNKLREYLIEVHKQSEHIELMKSEKQLEILDSFGDDKHKILLSEYKLKHEHYINLKKRFEDFIENSSAISKKVTDLEYEVKEIKQAKIKDTNEEEVLGGKRELLLNKKDLIENTNQIYELINGDGQSLLASISQIKKILQKNSEYDKSFEPYIKSIENTSAEIKELSSFTSNYSESIDSGENNLEEIEERLDLFYKLKKKYGKSLEDILNYLEKAENELEELKESGTSKEKIENTYKECEQELDNLGSKISDNREKFTKTFVDKINEELQSLGFNLAVFIVQFTKCGLTPVGKEQIQFLFSANPDEPPKPLLKVASGGELSRIMLAIKSCTCKGMPWHAPTQAPTAPTMIFDEIDVGISGEVASTVAKKLFKISRGNQVISITHQPIIAAMADEHLFVQKDTSSGVTKIFILEVNESNKADAIAHLLVPEKKVKDISEDARSYAKSLIENAKKIKENISKVSFLGLPTS
jgi:DNA repair protein RecN (Recombination protein N)